MQIVKLLGDRVAVSPDTTPETLGKEGILLASGYEPVYEDEQTSNNDKVRVVAAVGTGKNVEGIQPGDKVVLDRRKGPHYDCGEFQIYGAEAIIGIIPALVEA